MNKKWEHFKLVMTHKKYVFKYCKQAGIFWRGVKHDLSKLSPIEFNESAKYFTGDRSPIDNCKAANGYSKAWQHHKGRNTHHWEYWVDNLSKGGTPIQMPFLDAVELVCDYLGAGQAYMKDKFSFSAEWNWWQKKKQNERMLMHPQTMIFVDLVLEQLAIEENSKMISKSFMEAMYESATDIYNAEKEVERIKGEKEND